MPPSHPLFRRFENELTVGEQNLEWTMRGRNFFFRPVGTDVRIIWCELERRDMPDAVGQPAQLERVKKRLEKHLAQKRMWRFWPLDEDRELVLSADFALMRHKEANFWLRLEWLSAFDSREDLLFLPDLSSVESNLESSENQWLLVHALLRQEQWNWFVSSEGDLEELKRGIEAYMALSGHYLHYFGKGDFNFASLLHAAPDAPSEQWLQLRSVCNLLDRYFSLNLIPLSRRFYNREGKPQKRPPVYISRPLALSQHERLEALLTWRDFLHDKLPPEEIEVLLPKL